MFVLFVICFSIETRLHSFSLQTLGLLIADPLQNVIELTNRTDRIAEVVHVNIEPQGCKTLARVEERHVVGALAAEDVIVAQNLAEYRRLVAQYLIVIHLDHRQGRIATIEAHRYIVAVVEEIADYNALIVNLFALYQTLVACVGAGVVVEHQRGDHTPTRKVVDRVGTKLCHRNLCAVAVRVERVELEGFGHNKTQTKTKRVGCFDILVEAVNTYLAG